MSGQRLNGIIRAWEAGKPAFTCFAKVDKLSAQELTDAPYDGVVYEMEHNPYDVAALGDALQYMLNRKAIADSGSVAPAVTPLARIPANGAEMNQAQAKQVLDRGVYGVITPHVATVEQAYMRWRPAATPSRRAPRSTSPRGCAATGRPRRRATGA